MAATLTKAQLNNLLDVYRHQGGDAARELAPQYGITPTYVRKLASIHGIKAKRKGSRRPRSVNDPRWERARAIGSVVA